MIDRARIGRCLWRPLGGADRGDCLGPALLVLSSMLLQLWMVAPLFRPGEPVGADLSIHLAEAAHLVRALRGGDLDWWNPGANLGYPSGLYYQTLPQLIPALATLAVGDRLPLLLAFKGAIAATLVFLPLSVYRGLRIAGVDRVAAAGGASFTGLLSSRLTWGVGVDAIFSMGLYTQAWALLWTPLACGYLARWVLAGRRLCGAVCFSLLTGVCHPVLVFGVALPVLALLVSPEWRARARRLAVGGALVVASSAFFWLPVLVYYDSFGGFPHRAAGERGMPIGAFAEALVSGALLDAGRPPIIAALWACALPLARSRAGRFLAFVALAYAAVIVAFHPLGVVKDDLFPATRLLCLFQLSAAAAAGILVVDVVRSTSIASSFGTKARALALGLGFGAAWLLVAWTTARAAAQVVLTVRDVPEIRRDELQTLLEHLARRPNGRVLASADLGTGPHWWMYLPQVHAGRAALVAYGGAPFQGSSNFYHLRFAPPDRNLDVFGVRYAFIEKGRPASRFSMPDMRVVAETERFRLVERQEARLFRPVRVVGATPDERHARRRLVSAWLEARRDGSPEALQIGTRPPVPPDEAALGDVIEEQESLSGYDARVRVTGGRKTFALAVTFHPLWSATLDGRPVPIRRLSPDIMGVDVPDGVHGIHFRFTLPAWRFALVLVTVTLLLALLAWERREHRLPVIRHRGRGVSPKLDGAFQP